MTNLNKKVLIVETNASYRGIKMAGSYIQSEYYCNLLKENGYEAHIFIADPNNSVFQRVSKLISVIRKSDYVLGFGTPLLDFFVQWFCLLLNKKGVFCIDTIIVQRAAIKDHLKKGVINIGLVKFWFAQIVSDVLLKLFPIKQNLVNMASCEYVEEALKNTRIQLVPKKYIISKVKINKLNGVDKNSKKIILYYGVLFRGRGVIDLIKACHILWNKGHEFKLAIAGYPVEKLTSKSLKEVIKKEESKNIIIKGKIPEIEEYIKKSAAVVLPFRYACSYQTPYTLLESMGLGIPVITTNVGSHGEWIIHGKTGLMCEKENIEDIADKIEAVLTDDSLVRKITKGAKKLLEERYQEKDYILEMLSIWTK